MINTNKYNFEPKDISNPRLKEMDLQYIHVCYAEPLT